MSLELEDRLRTPYEAFLEKQRNYNEAEAKYEIGKEKKGS